MTTEETKSTRSEGADFLIAQYSVINDEARRLRTEGVTRLTFFLTITAALLAGVVALFEVQSQSPSPDYGFVNVVALAAALFLALIGWFTFKSAIGRDIASDLNLRAAGRISRYFSDADPTIRNHLLWLDHDQPTFYVTHNTSSIRTTTQACLAVLVAVAVGLAWNLVIPVPWMSLGAGVVAFGLSLSVLSNYSQRRFAKAREEAEKDVRFPSR